MIYWDMFFVRNVWKDFWEWFEVWRYYLFINKYVNIYKFFFGFWWGVGVFVIVIGIEKLFEKFDDYGGYY